ncbi:hypothetical protein PQX77_019892 [Marasmius sp. AFHP31]|nr:hypothetical protein PQX77_019892 [Marasmius sp. AFHP31]
MQTKLEVSVIHFVTLKWGQRSMIAFEHRVLFFQKMRSMRAKEPLKAILVPDSTEQPTFNMLLGSANLVPSSSHIFFPLTREGNHIPLRLAAVDGLFLMKWYAPAIMLYILSVMANDPSRIVRRHVARNACQSLAVLIHMGGMKASSKDTELLLIEEGGSRPERMKESKKTELDPLIKVLRKDRETGGK